MDSKRKLQMSHYQNKTYRNLSLSVKSKFNNLNNWINKVRKKQYNNKCDYSKYLTYTFLKSFFANYFSIISKFQFLKITDINI